MAAALAGAGILVTPDKVASMSYRTMQAACKVLGLPARGKATKLKQRLCRVEAEVLERLECAEDECACDSFAHGSFSVYPATNSLVRVRISVIFTCIRAPVLRTHAC